MAHAIERLLATPATSASLPSRMPSVTAVLSRGSETAQTLARRLAVRPEQREHVRVLERGDVTRILAQDGRAHGAPHDLRAARLRQRCHEADLVGREGLARSATTAFRTAARSASSGSAPICGTQNSH